MADLSFGDLVKQIGDVGARIYELGAAEGAAGNMSVCLRDGLSLPDEFIKEEIIELPVQVPELAGSAIIVTGSGCRLRDIANAPPENLAIVVVDEDGITGKVFSAHTANFKRVTSEFNSHLAIHHVRVQNSNVHMHTVLHAQPTHLTYLSHISAYQDERYFNQHLYRWQPETILSIPEGIGVLPFIVNGSDEQMTTTAEKMKQHSVVVWARHGIVARADNSIVHALDLIEYAEAAAGYEYLNLSAGEVADGLSADEIRAICKAWGVLQRIY